jgi:hypothetical protein
MRDPEDFIAFAWRGLALLLMGQNYAARKDFEMFYRSCPNDIGFLQLLIEHARLLIANKRLRPVSCASAEHAAAMPRA